MRFHHASGVCGLLVTGGLAAVLSLAAAAGIASEIGGAASAGGDDAWLVALEIGRSGTSYRDIHAHLTFPMGIFADGFESGDTSSWSSVITGGFLADSVGDFSGVQGGSGWSYGAYHAFDPTGFNPLSMWDGSAWHGTESSATPFIDASGGGPGADTLIWAVRRWTSSYAGAVRVSGVVFDRDPGCGDGADVRVLVNGTQIYEFLRIPQVQTPWQVDIALQVGDILDLAIDPSFDGACDATELTAVVSPLD